MRGLGVAGRTSHFGPRHLEQDVQTVSLQIVRVGTRLCESDQVIEARVQACAQIMRVKAVVRSESQTPKPGAGEPRRAMRRKATVGQS